MIFRGLKSNILINLAVLLRMGMFLINFVMVMTVKRDMLRAEITKGQFLFSVIENNLFSSSLPALQNNPVYQIDLLVRRPDFSFTVVLDHQGKLIYSGGEIQDLADAAIAVTRESIHKGRQTIKFSGKTWGVFWLQDRYMIISVPFYKQGTLVGGAGLVSSLENIYQHLRRTQKLFLIYIFINAAILTLIGGYRTSKIYLEPLRRLAIRAEDYKEEEGLYFAVRKEDNELHQLSKALNLMLERISEDKQKLRSTVMSLEKANIDLKQAQKEIIQAEKLASVGRLSAGIAHEIGNPIGIVMGYLELLKQQDISKDERSEYIRRTEDEFSRINMIIRQLLDLSRPSKEGSGAIHVHDIIDDITNVIKFQPLMSDISIKLLLKAENDMVVADPNQLRQVFLNLMLNAADAISTNEQADIGELIIKSEVLPNLDRSGLENSQDKPTLIIRVIDNGPGISQENLGNVFDPFFTTKEPGKGTGLGLSVSFMIVESIGGKITAANNSGQGTTMTLSLPLAGDMSAAKIASVPLNDSGKTHN